MASICETSSVSAGMIFILSATCGAFSHIDAEDPCKQVGPGVAVDGLGSGCRGLLGVSAALREHFANTP